MKIGLFPLMFLIFMTLKLTNTIAWSWWLVTMPLWGGFTLILGFMFVVGVLAMIANS